MSKKIYLTYKQIETLCFSKIVFISDAQLDISRSRKYYEFAIFTDENKIITEKESIVLLFSSVTKIEIPKSEFNLFKNQFKLPLGLLSLANRNVPKDTEVSTPVSDSQFIELYSRLRRSFTQLVLFGYKKNNDEVQTNLSDFLNKITRLSTFETALIKNIHEEGCFPQKVTKETKSEEFYKFIWWGKFTIDMILNPQKNKMSEDKFQAHRSWFKGIDVDNLSNNLKSFKNIPPLFREHSGVILGYFLAALSSSNINKKNIECELDSLLEKNLDFDNKYEVLFWGGVFQAFFVEELDYSYPNPIIQDDFFKMEFLSFSIVNKLLNSSENRIECDFKFKVIDSDDLVTNFEKIKEKNIKVDPIILDESELKKPFEESLLFGKNKERIGFINKKIGKANYLMVNEEGFELRSKHTIPSVVFYGELLKGQKESLKKSGINIKIKEISTLISKESKVLIAFLSSYTHENQLLTIYKNIIKSKKTGIDQFVFVWLVSKDNKTLHSPEFAFEKDNLKKEIELEFGLKTTVIVKNLCDESTGDIEVIRNLKLALKNYRAKNIEVIDHNFEEEHASWIITAINDYIVKLENVDYYSFSD